MSITIVVSVPPKELWPNFSRWSQRWVRAKRAKYRDACQAYAMEAWQKAGLRDAPRWESADAHAVGYFPVSRKRDGDNFIAALKGAFDGIQAAGIVANDHGLHHRQPGFGVDKANPRVEITITPRG